MPVQTRLQVSSGCLVVLTALVVAASACGDGAAAPGSPAGQAGAAAGGSSAGSGGPGTAGSPTACTPSVGGQPASAEQAGSSGQAGAAAGASGQAGGGSGATAGNGGSSPVDDTAALAPLNGYQLLDPCDLTSYQVQSDPGAVCPQLTAVKNQQVSKKIDGDPNVTYDVTLRVRGIMEGYWYDGGTLDPTSKTFYTGGVPTVGGFASACKNKASELPFQLPAEVSPTDSCFNGFNVFAMTVSAPKQHYYLNYTAEKNGDRPPHAVYQQDYTVTIKLQGQATLDFYIIGSDEHQCYNHDKVISGVTLASSPYIGEFVQFDVLKVARTP